jgi:hypothetical protein
MNHETCQKKSVLCKIERVYKNSRFTAVCASREDVVTNFSESELEETLTNLYKMLYIDALQLG